jgi:uncharacterized protein YciI
MHYLLFYEKAPGHAERAQPLQAEHLSYVRAAVLRGEIVLGGSLSDPEDGAAVVLFRGDSPAVAEAFAAGDPYVRGGVVSRWYVRPWQTVVGKGAAMPLPSAGKT